MKILAPINKVREVEPIIKAGADELYCGVLPLGWREKYTNVASPNRREWKVSNLNSFEGLKEVVGVAHKYKVPVDLTLNALYTRGQYDALLKSLEKAIDTGVNAIIVADLGLLLTLKKMNIGLEVHISTGGTTFNSQTIRFYQELGARKIIIPRHLRIEEITSLAKENRDIELEVFILNRGCKNIDGFCTFQHGVNEVLRKKIFWDIPKRLNFDYHLLNLMRRLPRTLALWMGRLNIYGSVGACFLGYDVSVLPVCHDGPGTGRPQGDVDRGSIDRARRTISSGFNLLSGVDTCGACYLYELEKAGIYSVKIVGRSNPTQKKLRDVTFLKNAIRYLQNQRPSRDRFRSYVQEEYRRIYHIPCQRLCYYV